MRPRRRGLAVGRGRSRRRHRLLPRPRPGGEPRPGGRPGARPPRALRERAPALCVEPQGPGLRRPRLRHARAHAGAPRAERDRVRGLDAGRLGTAPDALRRERPAGAPGGARGGPRGGLGERHPGALRARHRDERRAPRGGRADPRPRGVVQGGGAVRSSHRVPDRGLRPAARPGGVHRGPRAGVDRSGRDPGRRAAGRHRARELPEPGRAARQRGRPRHPGRHRRAPPGDGHRRVRGGRDPRGRQRPRRCDRGRSDERGGRGTHDPGAARPRRLPRVLRDASGGGSPGRARAVGAART